MKYSHFERFELELSYEDALSASHQGSCDDDVRALSETAYVRAQLDKLDPDKVRAELKGYGAWDAEELADHEQNLQRILWLAAGHIRDEYEE